MSFIEARNISKTFGDIRAVEGLSLSVEKGEMFGLVGSDGAGKSTFLRMVATMIPPTDGGITIGGRDVVTSRDDIKRMIGYMPQRFGLYQDLTVGENMDFFMDIFGVSGAERRARKKRFLAFSNLSPFVDRLAGNLSGGMKQKLGLACVLVHQPEVLILDEPTNGVDPVSRKEFWDILFQMKRDGMTILISTAYLDEGEKCDRIALMHNSRVIDSGNPAVIRGDMPDLEEAIIHRIQQFDRDLAHDSFKF
ncbi:MAG: ABC transporter ATP-binding protein [Deltaproteobacteria bacterium]|nr:ABC transporter ATP-binding protein [Deltaproteobacteria bacterium]